MAFNSKRIVASLAAVAAMGMALTGCGGDTANGDPAVPMAMSSN